MSSIPEQQPSQTAGASESTIHFQPDPHQDELLVPEIAATYAGLVMCEAKCGEVDAQYSTLEEATQIKHYWWQALAASHRSNLDELRHSLWAWTVLFPTPEHATENHVPARILSHGIQPLLKVLGRARLSSTEHLSSFISMAYSLMAPLHSINFDKGIWLMSLGGLAKFWIKNNTGINKKAWAQMAMHWYSLASEMSPKSGHLYYQLALLASPDSLEKMFYCYKSLCVESPSARARESILTAFDAPSGTLSYNTAIIETHRLLFKEENMQDFEPAVIHFTKLLGQTNSITTEFLVSGCQIAIINCCAILGWGLEEQVLAETTLSERAGTHVGRSEEPLPITFRNARFLHHRTAATVFLKIDDPNILSFVHAELVFLCHVSKRSAAMHMIDVEYPWELLISVINKILLDQDFSYLSAENFPKPANDHCQPLPEDYALRGLLWEDFFPKHWFDQEIDDDDEGYQGGLSERMQRRERILWHALRLEETGWIRLNRVQGRFYLVSRSS
jgi:hypothetical protein